MRTALTVHLPSRAVTWQDAGGKSTRGLDHDARRTQSPC